MYSLFYLRYEKVPWKFAELLECCIGSSCVSWSSDVQILPLTYLLTPWCRVLLEKLTGLQLVKKFPAFHGARRFITALTSVRHLSLSWASPIQSIYPHPTSCRSTLILFTHLRLGLPSGLFLTTTNRNGFLSRNTSICSHLLFLAQYLLLF